MLLMNETHAAIFRTAKEARLPIRQIVATRGRFAIDLACDVTISLPLQVPPFSEQVTPVVRDIVAKYQLRSIDAITIPESYLVSIANLCRSDERPGSILAAKAEDMGILLFWTDIESDLVSYRFPLMPATASVAVEFGEGSVPMAQTSSVDATARFLSAYFGKHDIALQVEATPDRLALLSQLHQLRIELALAPGLDVGMLT